MIVNSIRIALVIAMLMSGVTTLAQAQETQDTQENQETQATEEATFGERIQQALVDLQEYAISQKDQAYTQGKDLLGVIDAELEELQAEAAEASEEAQDRFAIEVARLEGLRAQANDELQQMGESAEDEWREAKEGFGTLVTEIETAIADARNDFQSEEN